MELKNHQKLNEKQKKMPIILLTDSNTTVGVVVDSGMDIIVEVSVD